jgi:hypothetical protein
MIATIDVRIECLWCGDELVIADAATCLVARCDGCATAVDLSDPAPAQTAISRQIPAAVAA